MTGVSLVELRLVLSGLPYHRLGVAVSGGSDSLALLHLLHDHFPGQLFAVTVNHGLRLDAASEALHVERICTGLGVPHDVLTWQGWDGKGNLQDQARRNRYALISDWAHGLDLDAVALGHTLDDQAETVLMRLARASGVDGLSAMARVFAAHGTEFVRPLLGVSRAALRDDLAARKVRWVDDPSNQDEDFDRIKARKALDLLAPLGIDTAVLSRVASQLNEARSALSRVAADWVDAHAKVIGGDVVVGRTALNALPAELSRRILSGALRWVSSEPYPPRSQPLAELLAAVRREVDRPRMTLHGCLVSITDMTVRIAREPSAVADTKGPTNAAWDVRWQLDGPHAPGLEIRALGEAVNQCPDWRTTNLPRTTLLASPSVWRGETLIAAPLAGFSADWTAKTGDKSDFAAFLISH